MPIAILKTTCQSGLHVQSFWMSAPQSLKDRVVEVAKRDENLDIYLQTEDYFMCNSKMEPHKIINWIEASGWKLEMTSSSVNSYNGFTIAEYIFREK